MNQDTHFAIAFLKTAASICTERYHGGASATKDLATCLVSARDNLPRQDTRRRRVELLIGVLRRRYGSQARLDVHSRRTIHRRITSILAIDNSA